MDADQQGTMLRGDTHGKGLAADSPPREGLLLGVVLALAACLPFLVATFPQLSDYPSHLARYHVMLDGGQNPFLARHYDFEWRWTGNLGADLLIWPLAGLFGLERAGWLIGLLLPPLTGLGVLAVEWTLRRRIGVGSLLAFATIWSPAMGMGFYNFALALALALFAFALWVRLEGWRWRWLVFLPIGFAVWLCHLAGWGVLGILVFGYEWHRRKGPAAFIAPWPLMPVFIPLLAGGAATGGLSYGEHVFTYKLNIWIQALRVQSFDLDFGALGLILLALVTAVVFRRIDGRLGWTALLLLVATLALPRHLGGGDFADYRLIAVALMVGCLAIDWRAPRWALWLVPLLFLARLGATAAAWHEQSRVLEADLKALDHLPQGASVAGAVVIEDEWPLNPFVHAPSYATVRRDALVNSHFAVPGVHMLRLRRGGPDFTDPSQRLFHHGGEPIDLTDFEPARQADYLWYFGGVQPSRMPAGARVLYRTPHSFLARLANRDGSR